MRSDFPEAYKQVIGQDFDYKDTKADLTQTERAKAVKEKAPFADQLMLRGGI